jgi:two-component system sensor histidine kinase/response regulator
MPFIDGYQLTGLIREHEISSGRHLPIVALTANALQGEADVCRAAGMDGYMFKPTSLPALDAMIQKWLPLAVELRRPVDDALAAAPQPGEPITLRPRPVPIDLSVMARLVGNDDPAFMKEMLELYWSTEGDTPEKLRELVQARDCANLKLIAHAAKGAAASAGAVTLAGLCKDLENQVTREDWDATARLTAEIAAAFEDIRAFIDNSQGRAG